MDKEIIFSKEVPEPIGPYSQAVRAGNMFYFSGMIALDASTGEMVGNTAAEQAKKTMENIKSLLSECQLDSSNVVKTSIFLANMHDFGAVNEVYATFFTSQFPARETIEVSRLPKDALVEISIIASK